VAVYRFDPDKDAWLQATRGIGFDEIIAAIESGHVLGTRRHPNQARYPGQWLYEVALRGTVCVVPYDLEGETVVLRTIYPSRKATRGYQKGEGA